RAARRGALTASGVSCRQPSWMGTAGRRSWLLWDGWTQRTSPLLVLCWATENSATGDSFAFFAWCGAATARRAHSASTATPQWGATAFVELAPWLCPSLLKRPADTGSG